MDPRATQEETNRLKVLCHNSQETCQCLSAAFIPEVRRTLKVHAQHICPSTYKYAQHCRGSRTQCDPRAAVTQKHLCLMPSAHARRAMHQKRCDPILVRASSKGKATVVRKSEATERVSPQSSPPQKTGHDLLGSGPWN